MKLAHYIFKSGADIETVKSQLLQQILYRSDSHSIDNRLQCRLIGEWNFARTPDGQTQIMVKFGEKFVAAGEVLKIFAAGFQRTIKVDVTEACHKSFITISFTFLSDFL